MDFDPERRELIEAVLEPLGEVPDNVRAALDEAVAAGSLRTEGDAAAKTTCRLRQSSVNFALRWRAKRWVTALLMLVVLWFAAVGPPAREEFRTVALAGRGLQDIQYMSELGAPFLPSMRPRSSIEETSAKDEREIKAFQRSRARGLPTLSSGAYDSPRSGLYKTPWEKAWESSPADPALYLAFACGHFENGDGEFTWRTDTVDVGEPLDRGNGIFAVYHSAALFSATMVDASSTRSGFHASSESSLQAAFAELERASRFPRWDDYFSRIVDEAAKGSPPPRDHAEQVISSIACVPYVPDLVWKFAGERNRILIQVWLEAAASDPDPAKLGRAEERFLEMCRLWPGIETGYQGRAYQRDLIRAGAKALAGAYKERGESIKESRYEKLAGDLLEAEISLDSSYGFLASHLRDFAVRRGGLFFDRPSPEDGRMVEYAMWERIAFHCATVLWVLIGAVLSALCYYGRSKTGSVAARIAGVLTTADCLKILLWSLGVPVTAYFVSTRLLPGRDEYITVGRFWLMLLQALCAVSAAGFGSAALAKRSLIARGAVFGFQKGLSRADASVAWFFLAMIPAASMAGVFLGIDPVRAYFSWAALGLMLLPFLWALFRIHSWWTAEPGKRLLQTAAIQVCIPVVCAGAVLTLFGTFAIHAWESHLVARTTTGSVLDPGMAFTSPEQLRKSGEIRQAMVKSLENP